MKTVVAAAIGECVHVAGVLNFLSLAEASGWRTIFLGPATPIKKILNTAQKENADLIGISYRLTPETGERLLAEFAEEADDLYRAGVKFAFGGTPPIANCARKIGLFEIAFDGSETIDDVLAYLMDQEPEIPQESDIPQTTIKRIKWKSPLPIIRHHFGLPSLQASVDGVRQIAESGILDVISLGIDQDAQENFFHPERQDKRCRGAGGVPVRSAQDYRLLFQASRCGNFPLMRTYSGTDDFIKLAEMYVDTIHLAWAAVPLFWFNKMDGRGPWDLEASISEHQNLMAWYGQRNIPVEANEAHHWGMRNASDVVFVASAYLAAYNARAYGVKDHIVQLMFNSPPGTSAAMDIAKMLAVKELISGLEAFDFRIWWQTRTGLLSYPLDLDQARAHLATSVYLQMVIKPNIVHVVGYTEADHASTADEVIQSCLMARKAIESALYDQIDFVSGQNIQKRIHELVDETKILIGAIQNLGEGKTTDPLSDATVLANAVTSGLLDAPQLANNPFAQGDSFTLIDDRGANISIDPQTGLSICEVDRVYKILAAL